MFHKVVFPLTTCGGEADLFVLPRRGGLAGGRSGGAGGVAAAAETERLGQLLGRRPFYLDREVPLRLALLRLAPERQVLLFIMHHVASDGWSLAVLGQEVAALHEAFSQGRPSPLPELPVQYADYAIWQRQWLDAEVLAAELPKARARGVELVRVSELFSS
ncbi:MAG: hypothetical protein HC897_05390 [Thermoanaerobaculia bacterium]|nr:hypothetical protein [Thermoanaerobaculia bacterium]